MKNRTVKSLALFVALALTSLSMSSCNRGYGCPTDFSIAAKVVKPAVDAAVKVIR